MRFRFPRSRPALALAAAVGVLALGGPTAPAALAETVQPPPLVPVNVPGGQLTPNGSYEQTGGCMQPNTGNSVIEEKPWSQRALGFEQAQDQGLTGQGQTVAVIDTGVNPHPRLSVEDGGSSVPDGHGARFDCDGHGTIVAGIIAAHPDPNTGFVGVAPDAKILSIRQSSGLYENKAEKRTLGDTETMARAIQYAVDSGASVINISQSSCQSLAQAMHFDSGNNMLYQAVVNAYNKGVVVVVAAGNTTGSCQKNAPGRPTTAVLPAWFDNYVITVASVNQQGAPSAFTVPGPWVDVAAPGENLISLDPGNGGTGLASQISEGQSGQLGPIQGTSFAAPYVSGLAALMKEQAQREGRSADARSIIDRIEKTAMHPGGNDGRNDIVGYGMIDPMAALNDVIPPSHQMKPRRLDADALQARDFPALVVAIGGAGAGIAAIVFTAFLVNAVRNVRARAAGRKD
ncbi:type VII secretion-associated serine protease mycosin [Saccharopolyspora rosea]|uniref:type VII secretion-associated serine protease mycosin n=1 Tax=Saccharopolyspora rosea TaxID=524884 RepID=UPI0021D9726D|nr:type VII secretion-associated serine protease mycosin [Saccharopolyspora rosea]